MSEDEHTRIDGVIDALSAELVRIGFGPLSPPKDPAEVALLAAAVVPWTLPAEVRRFFERVDVYADGLQRLDALCFPSLQPIAGALDDLESYRSELFPDALLPIGYTSQWILAVELDHAEFGPSGVLLQYDLVGGNPWVVSLSLSDWLDRIVNDLRAGRFVTTPSDVGSRVVEAAPTGEWNNPAIEHPRYVDLEIDVMEPTTWPTNWRALGEMAE